MPSLDSTIGAGYLGTLAAAILYGVTSVQAFLYFHDSRGDGRPLLAMVFFLWIIDTIHLGFTAHGLYFYLITSFGDFRVLLSPTWTILAQVYLTTISTLIARGFFARRVFVLCGRNRVAAIVLSTIITILALCVFGFGCAFASKSFVLKTYEEMNKASFMLYTSFGCAVVADTLIAVSLCTLLVRSRTGFKRYGYSYTPIFIDLYLSSSTDSIVTMLMAFTINTGLLTSLGAIACFVTYAIWPQRFIFMGIYFALSKLYINSLLASLNARGSLRGQSYEASTMPHGIDTPIVFPMKATSPITSTKESRYSGSVV
ncbi:hypothetical protein M413DRAFT_32922 [Hebeloma cylindrosporum]|uniref:DUF6534 domain-containing protein n=1 Tax=Hebeloma cylindrosporum TaxID=76867 RepID=A0A0C3BDL5_HEBCY|nr:hypothetical protein M413DRAFT_32922 [Hebeloma cylindrosporum h7]